MSAELDPLVEFVAPRLRLDCFVVFQVVAEDEVGPLLAVPPAAERIRPAPSACNRAPDANAMSSSRSATGRPFTYARARCGKSASSCSLWSSSWMTAAIAWRACACVLLTRRTYCFS